MKSEDGRMQQPEAPTATNQSAAETQPDPSLHLFGMLISEGLFNDAVAQFSTHETPGAVQ